MEFEEARGMEIKEAICTVKRIAGMKQRAAALSREFGDAVATDTLGREVEALEILIDIAERWKADAD